ncbi:MAG TPA: ABC transporter substrate-binding protein [Dehalococcoidia bacterium]|nr:ABC transporter substrate-binding protein [Dehalococcoidia bacterium]
MPVRACAIAIIMLALFAVACGDDDGGRSPSSSPSPSPPPTLAPGVTPGPGVTDSEIRLGMTSDLKGTGGTPYAAVSGAIEAYFQKVNKENGGVCGRNLVLVTKDDEYNPALSLAKTKELAEQDGVLAVIGALGTTAHLGVADYLNDPNADGNKDDGIPDLFVSTGYSGWGDVARWPWTIGFIPDYQTDAKALARYINENQTGKKVGILFESNELGKDYDAALKPALTDPALLISEREYDPAAPDIAGHITALSAAGADVLVLATTPEVSAAAITAAHGASYTPQLVLSYVNSQTQLATLIGGGAGPDQLTKGFAELKGAVSTTYLLSTIDDENSPPMVEHARIMQAYSGPQVSALTVYGQTLAETVVAAVGGICDRPTRKDLLRVAASLHSFHPGLALPGIDVNLSPNDHHAFQTLQLVSFGEDGSETRIGEPVSLE